MDDEGNPLYPYENAPIEKPFNVKVREGCRVYEIKDDHNMIYECAQLQMDYDKSTVRTGIPEAHRYVKMKDFRVEIYKDKDLARNTKEKIIRFIKNFNEFANKGVGLYIYSPSSGAGKTLLASILVNALIRQYDESPKFIKAVTFFEEYKRAMRQSSKDNPIVDDKLRALTNAKVLVIDDLGTEKVTDYISTLMYEVISKRTDMRKVTIITSKKKMEELKYDTSTVNQISYSVRFVELPNENVGLRVSNEANKDLDALLEL